MNLPRFEKLICIAFFEVAASAEPPEPATFMKRHVGETMNFAAGPDSWPDFFWDALESKIRSAIIAEGWGIMDFDVSFLKGNADETWGDVAKELYSTKIFQVFP